MNIASILEGKKKLTKKSDFIFPLKIANVLHYNGDSNGLEEGCIDIVNILLIRYP